MNFSDIIYHSIFSLFSPDNKYLAISNGTKLSIKYLPQLENCQSFSFTDCITTLFFSPDSKYILAVMSKSSVIEVRSINEEDWFCKIEDNVNGILNAIWSPDSRNIITFSDFQLKASIYSLVTKNVSHIRNPKYVDKGITFSSDGKFMALAERREAKDFVGVYFCGNWKLINHFQTDTFDLADIKWSPDDSVILVWDTILEYKLIMYCPATGIIAQFRPYDSALGLKSLSFSENSLFLAIGSFDEKVRLLNCLTWKLIIELEHKANFLEAEDVSCFKEELEDSLSYKATNVPSKYNMKETIPKDFKLPSLKVSFDKPNPQIGVSQIAWSPNNLYFATKNDNIPTTVWIWAVNTLKLKSILIHLNPVKNFSWSSKSNELAICTGNGKIYFWSHDGASVCDLPYEGKIFNIQKIQWSSDGKYLLLNEKLECVIAYPQID